MKYGCLKAGVWITIMSVCWALAMSMAEAVAPAPGGGAASFRADTSATAFSVMDDLRDQIADGGRATAWTQRDQRQAQAQDIGSAATVDVIWFDGDATDIWDLYMVSGNMPYGGGAQCAIDEATANRLFGSVDIVGLTVSIDGADMTISGVFALPGGIRATGADPGYGLAFCLTDGWAGDGELYITAWQFTVFGAGPGRAVDAAREWMAAAGVPTPQTSNDDTLSHTMFSQFARAAGWIIAIYLCALLLKNAWDAARAGARLSLKLARHRSVPPRRAAGVLAACLTVACALSALAYLAIEMGDFSLYIPPEYMPTQWSNLSFWTDLIKNYSQSAARLARSPVLRPDAMVRAAKGLCAVFSAASLAAMAHAISCVRAVAGTGRADGRVAALLAAAALGPLVSAMVADTLGLAVVAYAPAMALPFALCLLPVALCALRLPVKTPLWAFRISLKILKGKNRHAKNDESQKNTEQAA